MVNSTAGRKVATMVVESVWWLVFVRVLRLAGEKVERWADLLAALMVEWKEFVKDVRKVALKVGPMAAARASCSALKWVDAMVGVMAVPWVREMAALMVVQWAVLLDAALVALWAVLMVVVLAVQLDR